MCLSLFLSCVVARFPRGGRYCLCWVVIVGKFADGEIDGIRTVLRAAVPDCSLDLIGDDCSLDRVWMVRVIMERDSLAGWFRVDAL